MQEALPSGYIDTTAAVERIARNARNENIYSDTPADAWRKLCAELIPEGHVRPLMLTADGFVQKADITQFVGFADKYSRFETFLGYQPSHGSYDLLDERGQLHRFARAIFLESEIKAALLTTAEPRNRTEAIAKWLLENYPAGEVPPWKELNKILRPPVSRTTLWRARCFAWPSIALAETT